ncbi:unnamed protein product [Heligmosomoides polygyrus]|uniref:Endo/exonuclease/phosphatase domain-containing protein n=1 Tax=Heligmosomoides polygyrus TaxID=6339 RepID=A0A183F4Q0_HELPZ|nr:unnamed protein product [Heligmosomoides polygyrus]
MVYDSSSFSRSAYAGADAHSQSTASVENMRGSLMRGRHRGATELVRKFRNVSRTRVASLNVGTFTGRSCELVEALERRRVDLCAVKETRWSCRKSRGIGRGFKAVLCGSSRTTSGVGIIVSERFRDSITGCSDQAKDEFWNLLDKKTAEAPSKDFIIVAGDLNGHVGATKDGYSCHGGFGYGSRNADGERILEYAESHSLTIVNTVFRKRDTHLVSYYSGSTKTQIDFVLIAPQRLKQIERCGAARIKWWRMREKEAAVISNVRLPTVTSADETWKKATDAIRQAAQSELGITKPGRRKVDKQA